MRSARVVSSVIRMMVAGVVLAERGLGVLGGFALLAPSGSNKTRNNLGTSHIKGWEKV
jgi:hypothetical protein